MSNKIFLFIVCCSLIIVSCKKDTMITKDCDISKTIVQETEPCNMPDSMRSLPYCTSPLGISSSSHYPSFSSVSFNPNNANELVFFEYTPSQQQLVKFDLTSKITATLTTLVNGIDAHPYWSKDGFIYYNGNNQYIHKIDPNNLIPQQLNYKLSDGNPVIDYGFAYTLSGSINWPTIFYKNDGLGQHIDSVYCAYNNVGDISSTGLFAFPDTFSSGFDISLLSYPNNIKTITRLTNFMDVYGNFEISDIKWHPNNQDLFFVKQSHELYKINITTKKLTLVKRSGRAILFDSFDISPNGDKIVISNTIYNIDYTKPNPNPCQLVTSNYFTIMDLNGCNEHLLYQE